MRNDVKIQDIATGWFSKELRVTEGKGIYYWIIEHIGKDEKQAKTICQKMLEKEIINSVGGK